MSLLHALCPVVVLLTLVISVPAEVSVSVRDLATDNTEFGLDLYKEVAEDSDNVFLSPYSISVALAMLYRGANGNTKEEVRTSLDIKVHSMRSVKAAFGKNVAETYGIGERETKI